MTRHFTSESAREELIKIGFSPMGGATSIASSTIKTDSDLTLVKRAYSILGAEGFSQFTVSSLGFFAARQLSRKKKSDIKFGAYIPLLRKFFPVLKSIFENKELKKEGYYLVFGPPIDQPLSITIQLCKKGPIPGKLEDFARININFYLDRNQQPSMIIGNFQGGNKTKIDSFRKISGKNPLDFFIDVFQRAVKKGQVVALNPRHHSYRNTNPLMIAASMVSRGKLTEEENELFAHYQAEIVTRDDAKGVIEKIEAEQQRIARDATGMHKAAFKKAGFKHTKSRYWRLRRTQK